MSDDTAVGFSQASCYDGSRVTGALLLEIATRRTSEAVVAGPADCKGSARALPGLLPGLPCPVALLFLLFHLFDGSTS